MAALCGAVKVILSFFRHGKEGAVERHRSRLTVNFDEQRNISIFKKHLCDFLGIKEQAVRGPFLEDPGNFTGPELYFKIKIYGTLA